MSTALDNVAVFPAPAQEELRQSPALNGQVSDFTYKTGEMTVQSNPLLPPAAPRHTV